MLAYLLVVGLPFLWIILSPRVVPRLYYRFLFLPHEQLGDASELRELAAEHNGREYWIRTYQGHDLHAYCFGDLSSDSYPILYGIGRDGDIARRVRILKLLLTSGHPVFIYEHSGYGQSGGKPSLKQLREDAISARLCLQLKSRRPNNEIILMGESFGGAVLVDLMKQAQPAALILKSSFASFVTVAKERCMFLYLFPRFLFPHPRFETAKSLTGTKVPVLVIHGKRDTIAGWHHAKRLQEAARGKLLELPTSRHSYIKPEDESAFIDGVREFLAEVERVPAL